jgi:prephenate dehydrogenase
MTQARGDVGIIGAGRFGAYYAGQLERAGYRVHRADVTDAADVRALNVARACASPIVIYAVPIRSLERAILETRDVLAPEAVVMDVSSVKIIPCAWLERHLPGRRVVGTHPLFGPQSAPVSCAGQRIAVCAIGADEDAAAQVERMANALELIVVRCTPAEHDTQVARTQFLTHFIGRGTVRAGIARLALSTRTHEALMDIVDVVCHDSIELFEDMAAYNPKVPEVRAEFLAALQAIDAQLARREREVSRVVDTIQE